MFQVCCPPSLAVGNGVLCPSGSVLILELTVVFLPFYLLIPCLGFSDTYTDSSDFPVSWESPFLSLLHEKMTQELDGNCVDLLWKTLVSSQDISHSHPKVWAGNYPALLLCPSPDSLEMLWLSTDPFVGKGNTYFMWCRPGWANCWDLESMCVFKVSVNISQ